MHTCASGIRIGCRWGAGEQADLFAKNATTPIGTGTMSEERYWWDSMRICAACGRDMGGVGGYTIARDVLRSINGEQIVLREICAWCVQLGDDIGIAELIDAMPPAMPYPMRRADN